MPQCVALPDHSLPFPSLPYPFLLFPLQLQLQLQFCDANFVCQTFYWHISCSPAATAVACLSCRLLAVGCWLRLVLWQQTRLKLKCALFSLSARSQRVFQNNICIFCVHNVVCGFKAHQLEYFTLCASKYCHRAN